MSAFDSIQQTMFSGIEEIFGDIAVWNPSDGTSQVSDKVLYNNPDSPKTIGDVDKYSYNPYKFWFEYFVTQFIGLKASVDNGNIETVVINGTDLEVKEVKTKDDGKTFVAYCDAPVKRGIGAMVINTNDDLR